MAIVYPSITHRRDIFLLLDEGQHAGEDAGTHDEVSLLLHVGLEDTEHHWQQDAPRLFKCTDIKYNNDALEKKGKLIHYLWLICFLATYSLREHA